METQTFESVQSNLAREHSLTFLQTHVLRHAHPRKAILDTIGVIWATYFLWNHNWFTAFLSVIAFSGSGFFAVWDFDPELLAKTTWGRLALLHLKPFNLALNVIGVAFAAYGIWIHGTEAILAGLSILMLGHMQGWAEIHPSLEHKL